MSRVLFPFQQQLFLAQNWQVATGDYSLSQEGHYQVTHLQFTALKQRIRTWLVPAHYSAGPQNPDTDKVKHHARNCG